MALGRDDKAVNRLLDDHDAQPKPFQWVAAPDMIIAAVNYGRRLLDRESAAGFDAAAVNCIGGSPRG
jgi:hypothetical protein